MLEIFFTTLRADLLLLQAPQSPITATSSIRTPVTTSTITPEAQTLLEIRRFSTSPTATAAELTDVELSRVQIDVEEPSSLCTEPEPHSQSHQTQAHQLKHIQHSLQQKHQQPCFQTAITGSAFTVCALCQ